MQPRGDGTAALPEAPEPHASSWLPGVPLPAPRLSQLPLWVSWARRRGSPQALCGAGSSYTATGREVPEWEVPLVPCPWRRQPQAWPVGSRKGPRLLGLAEAPVQGPPNKGPWAPADVPGDPGSRSAYRRHSLLEGSGQFSKWSFLVVFLCRLFFVRFYVTSKAGCEVGRVQRERTRMTEPIFHLSGQGQGHFFMK